MLLLALALRALAADAAVPSGAPTADRPAVTRLRTLDTRVLDVRADRPGWWIAEGENGAIATVDGDARAVTACGGSPA